MAGRVCLEDTSWFQLLTIEGIRYRFKVPCSPQCPSDCSGIFLVQSSAANLLVRGLLLVSHCFQNGHFSASGLASGLALTPISLANIKPYSGARRFGFASQGASTVSLLSGCRFRSYPPLDIKQGEGGVRSFANLKLTALSVLMSLALIEAASAQAVAMNEDLKKFIGSWRLVATTADGKIRPERGVNPTGIITYHESGWMAAQIQPDRPPIGMAGAVPSGEEAKAALYGYTAYFGTFTVDAQAKIVTHHRKGNVTPGWEKTADIRRAYVFDGPDRVILYPVGNKNELIWERLK